MRRITVKLSTVSSQARHLGPFRFSSLGKWVVSLAMLLLPLLGTPRPVTAQQAQQSMSQTLEKIRQRMEQGLSLFVAGKYGEAAKEFETGYSEHAYSAFLFNAGVCYQKQEKPKLALAKFQEYLKVDPQAPDAPKVQERIRSLEALLGQPPPPPPPPPAAPVDGGAPPPPPPPPPPPSALPNDTAQDMRSLVVVETEPPNAPLSVYARTSEQVPPFKLGTANKGWQKVVSARAPTSLSLAEGRYHIVVEKFRDFNPSETDIDIEPGHVHHFKANLSQGVFMAFLRVSANRRGAHVYLNDRDKKKPEWGTTPYGELVPAGTHEILVEAPGFLPLLTKVTLKNGEQKEVEVRLSRVDYGYVRVTGDAPEIHLRVDGKPAGVWQSGQPPLDVKATAGEHRVQALADGRKDFDAILNVPKGQVLPINLKMIPKYPRGAAWTQAVLSGLFIGAGVFFGVESKNLKKDLEADRRMGVLEESDSRFTQGQIYAIGADAGFLVGGVLAALSTYNFVKDPLPESSHKALPIVEFDDPLSRQPGPPPPPAPPAQKKATRPDALRPRDAEPAVRFTAGPGVAPGGAGFFVGGTF